MEKIKGFTLIEMLVAIAIIVILASVALYSVTKYIDKGRDATIKGRLVTLVTAGELWYDRNNSSYASFCDPNLSIAVKIVWDEIPSATADKHCNIKITNNVGVAWAACARFFVYPDKAFCVDNKGNQKEINNSDCTVATTNCCFAGVANCIP
ncbi:MAG: type II secretion system protein [Patescibacteria group bacterium]